MDPIENGDFPAIAMLVYQRVIPEMAGLIKAVLTHWFPFAKRVG